MISVERRAIVDAKWDYTDRAKTNAEWMAYCARVRGGDAVGPVCHAIEAVGVRYVCASWGVDPAEWDRKSTEIIRYYNGVYCSTIEVLVTRTTHPGGSR